MGDSTHLQALRLLLKFTEMFSRTHIHKSTAAISCNRLDPLAGLVCRVGLGRAGGFCVDLMKVAGLSLSLGLASVACSHAAVGDPDPGFGSLDGVSFVDLGGIEDAAWAVVALADGRVLLSGITQDESGMYDGFLIRLDESGAPDPSFGDGTGCVTYDISGGDDYVHCAVVLEDGRILVGGSADGGNGSFDAFVARFTEEGDPDPTFAGGEGIRMTGFEDLSGDYVSIAPNPDGTAIAVGYITDAAGASDLLVAKITEEGELDERFSDGAGVFGEDVGGFADRGTSVCISPDGGIRIAGCFEDKDGGMDGFVAAYTADGDTDTAFGDGSGIAILDAEGSDDFLSSIAMDASGRVLVAGQLVENESTADVFLARLLADGTADEDFGDGYGYVTADLFGGYEECSSMVVQEDGSVILSGTTFQADDDTDFFACRFEEDGVPDVEFGPDGVGFSIYDLSGFDDYCYHSALQADGRILFCGESDDGEGATDVSVLRIDGGGTDLPDIMVEDSRGSELSDGDLLPSLGSVKAGSTVTRKLTIRNVGGGVLSGIKVRLTGSGASSFDVKLVGEDVLNPGESATVRIAFKPSSFGVKKASVRIDSNDEDENPFSVKVMGLGVSPEISVLRGTELASGKSVVDFGKCDVDSSGKTLTFRIRNVGNGRLGELAVRKSGSGMSDFKVSPLEGTSLAAGGTMAFKVTFRPSMEGKRTAMISIPSNDPDENPFEIRVIGRAD